MKVTGVFCGSVFSFLFSFAILGGVDVARAQSICSCPAAPPGFPASTNLGGGRCQTFVEGDGVFVPGPVVNAICKAGTPQIGQIAASQQQLSFSTVAGVLRTRRDQLQGPLGSQWNSTSPLTGYSTFNLDESFGLLGYASGTDKNPLYKAPAAKAPAVAAGPSWAAWVEGLGDWERRSALDANDIGRTQSTYGVHAGFDGTWKNAWMPGDYIVAGVVTNWITTRINLTG